MFDKLKGKLDTSITLKTHTKWKIPTINENSTVSMTSVKRFENGNSNISRKMFMKD